MRLPANTRVDRYLVEHLLGTGGMADVYAVRHATLGSVAALKVLRVRSPALVGRLLREGRVQASLRHPNIVTVFDVFEVLGSPALLMERVDGPTLAQVLACGPLLLARAERLARGLMAGLYAAHQIGLVHRDFKPSNVLIARGDRPQIADFGLVTSSSDSDGEAGWTHTGQEMGTPAYMAPEQRKDAHDVDCRADVFALGLVLQEMSHGVVGVPARMTQAIRESLQPKRDQRIPDIPSLWELFFSEPFNDPFAVGAGSRTEPGESLSIGKRDPGPPPGIPRPARSIIGRDTEIEQVLSALDSGTALLTLVGTAGVGKTRLAIAVAARWLAERGPALWVDLQAARDEQDLIRAIAVRLGDSVQVSAPAIGRTLARQGALLLVLDNLEQLPWATGAAIADLLRSAPSLRILGSSRQALAISEERTFDVLPFSIPDDVSIVCTSPGWCLLATAAPVGALDTVDGERAKRLLRAFDGLPLALELAAGRLEVLTIDALEQRLPDRFAVLSDPRAPNDRHGTLYNAIALSWSLLSPIEQDTLAQLSAFVEPFELDAAEGIAREPAAVLDAIHALVRRSMVHLTGLRFSLLTAIRAFAARQLNDSERRALWIRHAAWHAEQSTRLARNDRLPMRARRANSITDFEAVIERAFELPELVDDALTCAVACCDIYQLRGPVKALLRTADQVLALVPVEPSDPRAKRSWWSARFARTTALRRSGRRPEAKQELETLSQETEDPVLRAKGLAFLADICDEQGLVDEAADRARQSLALATIHGPAVVAAKTQNLLGTWHAQRREDDLANERFSAALAAIDPADIETEFEVRKGIGWAHLTRCRYAEAAIEYPRVFDLACQLDDPRGMAYAQGQLGLVSEGMGDLASADLRYARAAAGMAEYGDPIFSAYYNAFRGRLQLRLGETHTGIALLEGALQVDGLTPGLRSTFLLALSLGHAALRNIEIAERFGLQASDVPEEAQQIPGVLARGLSDMDRGDRAGVCAAVSSIARARDGIIDIHTQMLITHLLTPLKRW